MRRGFAPAAAIILSLLSLTFCPRPTMAYEQRIGTFSLGLQGGAGMMSGSDSWRRNDNEVRYDSFDWGGGLGIHIRYALDRAHAVGITFEDLRFDRKSGATMTAGGIEVPAPDQYQLNNYMLDYYLYFHRRYKESRYVVLGVGVHRPSFRVNDDESILPGEGFIANFGGGLEYFVRRPFSIDASLRGYYFKPKGGSGIAGELMLGFHYYLLN